MKKVTEKLWISHQPTAADMDEAKTKGIVGIINNRPDHEDGQQPTAERSAADAAERGLSYTHIPVFPGKINREQVRAFQQALAVADGPVLAHCKTGTRSLTLWSIGEVLDGRMSIEQIGQLGGRLNIDMAGAKAWLNANA